MRHGLPTYEGCGIDDLPLDVTEALTEILPCSLDVSELKRSFRTTRDRLLGEIGQADSDLLERLREPLGALTR